MGDELISDVLKSVGLPSCEVVTIAAFRGVL